MASARPAWLQWRDWILSIAVWIAYAYLIREAFIDIYLLCDAAFQWAFGQAPPPDVPAMFRFLYALGIYAVVVVLNGTILIGWATYNQLRFRGPDDRKALGRVSIAQLSEFYGFSDDMVAEWQQARSLVVIHDAEGKMLSVVMPNAGRTAEPPSADRPVSAPPQSTAV
ncbi:MAG: poly-beta-1,6-N-acetyl-D-glucosamine biosynthesis protein PgaD [Pseudomonadota bacterium]